MPGSPCWPVDSLLRQRSRAVCSPVGQHVIELLGDVAPLVARVFHRDNYRHIQLFLGESYTATAVPEQLQSHHSLIASPLRPGYLTFGCYFGKPAPHRRSSSSASPDAEQRDSSSTSERLENYNFEEMRPITYNQTSEGEEEKGIDSGIDSNPEQETAEQSRDESMESSTPSKRQLIFHKLNLFIEEQEYDDEELISEELIIDRINPRKGMNTCQLGQILPLKWKTVAGACIGYVRNYPSELQFRALEHVNLSPSSSGIARPFSLPRGASNPWSKTHETSTLRETIVQSKQ
ncbi:hypothetical protein KSP39_PZI019174 [Platanthera zijinensis]|uniref:Uncharacterized protein n=1 Tax=Platanthera zijinensis TaxID=2320716 RepID=A0AAP0FY91_9ASPA